MALRTQLQLQRRQLAVAEHSAAMMARLERVSRSTRTAVGRQLRFSDVLEQLTRDLEAIARATLRHAANIDRKTGRRRRHPAPVEDADQQTMRRAAGTPANSTRSRSPR